MCDMLDQLLRLEPGSGGRAEFVGRLRADPRTPGALELLARSAARDVRGAVPSIAHELLGEAALPIVKMLLDDRDPDNRGTALSVLAEIDPSELTPLLPKLHRRLRTAGDYEVLATAWQLARAKDILAVPFLEKYRDRHADNTWQHKAIDVVIQLLVDPASIAARIVGHDHDHMGWLSNAATVLGTDEAFAALRAAKTSAPDERCRMLCDQALARASR
jgi:hypothetical protein